MAKVVSITGGTGFIGRHLLARHVALGDHVRYLTRKEPAEAMPGAEACIGDLTAPETLRRFVQGADVLYHCAAELRDAAVMEKTNVAGTANLLHAATGEVGRWVQLSSTGVYGAVGRGVVREDADIRPRNPYERSKATADALVLDAAEKCGLPCVLLRPSNVYGTDMPNQSLFQLIRMIDKGLFFYIGPRGAMANYIHVENVVDALQKCGTMPPAAGRIYNLSDHRTMEQFVDVIAQYLGKARPKYRVPKQFVRLLAQFLGKLPSVPLTAARVDALTVRTTYSNEKIERELGYHHRVGMEDGMKELTGYWLKMAGR